MFRLTLILALVIFAIFVLVPQQDAETDVGAGQANRPETLSPESRAARETTIGDALREGPDGRLVLRTTTGEDLPIDLVVEPSELATAEPGDEPPIAGTSATDAPDTARVETEREEAPDGVTRLRVTGDRVNFRAGPSTDDEILAALTLGTEVELIERVADGWAHLRVPATGLTGYMSGDFLEPAN